jgi:hypothetical protein
MIIDTPHWIDVRPNLASGVPPVAVLKRPLLHGDQEKPAGMLVAEVARAGRYWVPLGGILTGKLMWTLTQSGEFVRVPVHAYQARPAGRSVIFGLGLELAFRAYADYLKHSSDPIERVVLVLNNDCDDLREQASPEDAFRCYIGLAFVAPDQY